MTTNSKVMKKFIPSTVEVNRDTDILVEDVLNMGQDGIAYFVDEAIERGDNELVYVVGEDLNLAENIAIVMNLEYEKEMELMKEAQIVKEEVVELVEESMKQSEVQVDEEKNAAARAFLEAHGGALVNSQKASKKSEEKEGEEVMEQAKTVVKGRRRLASSRIVDQHTNVKVENEVKEVRQGVKKEVEVKGRRRLASASRKEVAVGGTRRRIKREASLRHEFKKHEGQWWTNVELYPELKYMQHFVNQALAGETMSCPELGIEAIVFVEPEEISRYRNRTDISVVIQMKSNGAVLEFPIKEASSNSRSPLTSTSIGWVEYNGKVRPAFGFWRPNALEVSMKCSCGHTLAVNTGNVYCPQCKTRHDDVEVQLSHHLDFAGDVAGWVFQEIPNVVVPKGFLAIVMALAHWDAGYDMEGLIEEEE